MAVPKMAAPTPPRLAASFNDAVCLTPSPTTEERRAPQQQEERPSTPTTATDLETTTDRFPPGEWKEVVSKKKKKILRASTPKKEEPPAPLRRRTPPMEREGLHPWSSLGRFNGRLRREPLHLLQLQHRLQFQPPRRCQHRNRNRKRASVFFLAVASHTPFMKSMTWTK